MRNDLIYRQAVIDRLLEMAGFESVRELYECMVAEKKEARWLGGVNRGRLGSCLVLWRNIKGLTIVPWKPDDYDFCSKAVRRTDER